MFYQHGPKHPPLCTFHPYQHRHHQCWDSAFTCAIIHINQLAGSLCLVTPERRLVFMFGCLWEITFWWAVAHKPAGWATTSFERCSSPHQIKLVAATLLHSTTFLSSHGLVETVLWKLWDWSWRFVYLATPFTRLHTPWFIFVGLHPGVGVSGEIAHVWCTLTTRHELHCCHMQYSW